MGKIYVLPKKAKGGQPCSRNESLPHFYMSDYSVLGILVREFEEAGAEVFIHDATHMQDLFRVFKKFRLDFEIADILDQVYQG